MKKQELETLYKTNTLRQIAQIMNLSNYTVREIFELYNIKRRPRGNPYGVPFRTKNKKGYIKFKSNL